MGKRNFLSVGMKAALQSFSDDGGKTWEPQSVAFPHVNSIPPWELRVILFDEWKKQNG